MLHATSWLPPHLPRSFGFGASSAQPPHSLPPHSQFWAPGAHVPEWWFMCVFDLANGLPLACSPSSGLLRLTWLQLDTHIMDLGAGWPHIWCPDGARGLNRALPRVCVQWSQVSKWNLQPTPMAQYLLLDVYYKD